MDWGIGEYERTARQLMPAAEEAVAALGPLTGRDVLDVACGTGNATVLAARAGATVTGVDLSPRLVTATRERAAAEGLEAVTVLEGDACALPLADASMDAAVSVFGVIFASPPQAAAGELLRVVRPGGRIVITAWIHDGPFADYGQMVGAAMAEAAAEAGKGNGSAADQEPPAGPSDEEPQRGPMSWGDRDTLRELFPGREITRREVGLPFTDESPEVWIADQADHHPMWVAARSVLGTDRWESVRAQALQLFADANEDPGAFRVTSRYVVATIER